MNWPLIILVVVLVVGFVGGLVMWSRFGANSNNDGGQ
jgi:hypothetical protein